MCRDVVRALLDGLPGLHAPLVRQTHVAFMVKDDQRRNATATATLAELVVTSLSALAVSTAHAGGFWAMERSVAQHA
jgi:hypothetical protein